MMQEKESIHQQIGLKVKRESSKMLPVELSLYGAETGTLRKVDRKNLRSLKCGAGEG
jgi:hypothetical protein